MNIRLLLIAVLLSLAGNIALAMDQNTPQITIRKEGDQFIEEYRVHGQLYLLHVIPKHGKPYYLYDSNGNGEFDVRKDELGPKFQTPKWVLFKW